MFLADNRNLIYLLSFPKTNKILNFKISSNNNNNNGNHVIPTTDLSFYFFIQVYNKFADSPTLFSSLSR